MINDILVALADKYERKEFLDGDPSWFMHQVDGDSRELLAFIASSLSYGSRKQFLPKIQLIFDFSNGDVREWLVSRRFETDIPSTDECYYRLFTCRMMNDFLRALAVMVDEYGSIKSYVSRTISPSRDCKDAVRAITEWFREHGSVGIIPKDCTSSCKRVCMFMRWMTREGSPVDLGVWSDIIDASSLIIPMDTHVVQEANRLGLITSRSTSMSSAIRLTNRLKEIFPNDPVKGDYALFGLGVDSEADAIL